LNWVLIRASGVIAYLLLSLSVLWGLALAGGLVKRSPKSLNYVHESLSIGALVATAMHVLFLSVDRFVEFDLDELLVPGASDWRPVAVAFGILAFYALFLVTVSFYARNLIGQRVWRMLHYASFGIWVASLSHGLLAGTDRSKPWMLGLYGATAAAVVVVIIVRYQNFGSKAVRRRNQGNQGEEEVGLARSQAIERALELSHDRSTRHRHAAPRSIDQSSDSSSTSTTN
jgi:predicted ferric reductase